MRRCLWLAMLALILVGCDKRENIVVTDIPVEPDEAEPTAAADDHSDHGHVHETFALTGDNTQVLFVGSKKSGDSHQGGFKKVEGLIELGGDDVEAIEVTIDVDSMVTDAGRLTGHLKSEDFFSAQEFPEIGFVATAIEGDEDLTITGDLTMHGQTNEISFPAKVNVNGGQVELESEFTVDRTEFGMDYTGQPDNPINAEVKIKILVGQGGLDESSLTGSDGGGGGRQADDDKESDRPSTEE